MRAKNRVFLAALVVSLIAALVGGATMAWFTDSASSEQTTFAAGTLMIEAGDSTVIESQYFDPSKYAYVYGVEQATGTLYEIDVANGTSHKLVEVPNYVTVNATSPNGLAYDNANRRLYFSVTESLNDPTSDLYFYDFIAKELLYAGKVDAMIYGATFNDGYLWFIGNDTDTLYRVSFDEDGCNALLNTEANITGGAKSFRFGDIAIDIENNVIYSSTLQSGITPAQFFKYDLGAGTYQMIKEGDSSSGLQLAFGSDGQLYGHSTGNGAWYLINTETGDTSDYDIPNSENFTDLASGYTSVWNPGDSSRHKFHVKNVGTKRSFVRVTVQSAWYNELGVYLGEYIDSAEYDGPVVNFTLDPACAVDWVEVEGRFYYKHILAQDEATSELIFWVELDGPNTCNEYQGKLFKMVARFEAIQTTHEAEASWDMDYNNGNWTPIP